MKEYTLSPDFAMLRFPASVVVSLYLDSNAWWFKTKDNALYGKRAEARRALLYFLKHGEDNATTKEMIYVINHFQREWLGTDPSSGSKVFVES